MPNWRRKRSCIKIELNLDKTILRISVRFDINNKLDEKIRKCEVGVFAIDSIRTCRSD